MRREIPNGHLVRYIGAPFDGMEGVVEGSTIHAGSVMHYIRVTKAANGRSIFDMGKILDLLGDLEDLGSPDPLESAIRQYVQENTGG